MTQPETPAVGGEPIAPEPTPEDRLTAAFAEEDEQQDDEPAAEDEGEQPETEGEDEPEIEAEDIPPIDAPVSWTADEKERFAGLPRETQEFIAKRESERERFVQSKAQEAAQARQSAEAEARQYIVELQGQVAERLEQYAEQLTVAEPDVALLVSENPQDRALYAQQDRAYKYYSAQRLQAQREAQSAREQAQRHQEALQQHEANEFHQRLSQELPEFFDETKGPELKNQLATTAKFLGFTDEQIYGADADQILALRKVSEIKAKAEKYDAMMKKQMEKVRGGKSALPPVSKPGAARAPGAAKQASYQADRDAMRRGDRDATARILSAVLDPNLK